MNAERKNKNKFYFHFIFFLNLEISLNKFKYQSDLYAARAINTAHTTDYRHIKTG